jgi:hypothetical protein
MRSRNLKRKYSKSFPGIEKEWPFKNYYTKFFGGNLGLERLHPPYTQYLVARILNWCPVYQKTYFGAVHKAC